MEKAAAGGADVPPNTSAVPLIPPDAELHYGTGSIPIAMIDELENMSLTKLQKWSRSAFGIPSGTCISVREGNHVISSGKHMIMHAIKNDGKHFEIIAATNGDTQQQQQAIESLRVKKEAVPPSQQQQQQPQHIKRKRASLPYARAEVRDNNTNEEEEEEYSYADEGESEHTQSTRTKKKPRMMVTRTHTPSTEEKKKKSETKSPKAPRVSKGKQYFKNLMATFPRAFHEDSTVFYIRGDKYHLAHLGKEGDLYTRSGQHFAHHTSLTAWLSSLSVAASPMPRTDIYAIDPSAIKLVTLAEWEGRLENAQK